MVFSLYPCAFSAEPFSPPKEITQICRNLPILLSETTFNFGIPFARKDKIQTVLDMIFGYPKYMAKIFLVDDDTELLSVVAESLQKEGHLAEMCSTKSEATRTLKESGFDLLVLDVGLPDGSGFDICKEYRANGGVCPIIMLTGKADVRDKEHGLDSGADDYLTKPFSTRELAARVRALLRRPSSYIGEIIEHNGIKLDCSNRQAFKNGKAIKLQPLDYSLLEYLMKNPNQVLNQENILRRVWESYTESGIEALRAAVKRIRKEIDDDGKDSLIETVYKVGYAFRPRPEDA